MKEIKELINKLENELHSTSNPFITELIKNDIANLYRISQELFYIIERNK